MVLCFNFSRVALTFQNSLFLRAVPAALFVVVKRSDVHFNRFVEVAQALIKVIKLFWKKGLALTPGFTSWFASSL